MNTPARPWWQDGVIYQIYPRSFQDSAPASQAATDASAGVGDLPGILRRLDYLVDLGIDAVWISPFYPSPMADFGYDVSDYTGVDPLFGTLDDFDRLTEAIHARSLKLILDFVPNHTSDLHPWFLESRSSRTNPKRDWYIWRDPAPVTAKNGSTSENPASSSSDRTEAVPNNWMSNFGGAAWTFDNHTGQFFYHSFLPQQPDLNWRNLEVRTAVYNAMRFWLDRGVDGFRMDVLWLLIKDDQFRDNPINPDWKPGEPSFWRVTSQYTANRPETLAIVAQMRDLLNSYPGDRVLIGEIYLPLPELVRYYGQDLHGAQMPFNFHLIQTEWNAEKIATLIRDYEAALPPGAWPNWVMGNHDQKRLASRLGSAQARVAAVLLLTLRGTPTLYYADELGMPDAHISPDQIQDPAEKRQPGIGQGRDPERTPMLWDRSPQAGFTTSTHPWLPLADTSGNLSVEAEHTDPASVLTLYRRLLGLRRSEPALHAGDVTEVASVNGVLRYTRTCNRSRLQILLNLTTSPQITPCQPGTLILTSDLDDHSTGEDALDQDPNGPQSTRMEDGQIALRPSEAVILRLRNAPPPPH